MVKFCFVIRALQTIYLPAYKGSTFRGGFGHAFKRTVCTVRNATCETCLLQSRCIYSYIFETPPPENAEILSNYQRAPHPFVIEPPFDTKRTYTAGDTLTFGLILLGRAAEYLPYFIYTFEELGRMGIGKGKGRYELLEVICEGDKIYSSEDRSLKPVKHNSPFIPSYLKSGKEALSPLCKGGPRGVTLNFLTPTRIVMNNDLVVEPEFHQIIRPLLRRISTISYFHYGERLDLDFKGIIERAGKVKVKERNTRWHDWERYSARQDTRMKMGGFVGRVTFEGELGEFMPFIEIGERIHVGKGTSFGLGKYEKL